MKEFRKNLAGSGIFAAFFVVFAILASFHYHESAVGEVSSSHCAVCHNSSSSKALADEPAALPVPSLAYEKLESFEASQAFAPAPTGTEPIRGPPLA